MIPWQQAGSSPNPSCRQIPYTVVSVFIATIIRPIHRLFAWDVSLNTRIVGLLVPLILSWAISAPAFAKDSQNATQGTDVSPPVAGQSSPTGDNSFEPKEENSFLSRVKWKARFGGSDFHVYGSNTFGVGIGIKGNYATADGTKLEVLLTVTADFDRSELDSDHIPVWSKSYFKAEKELLSFSPAFNLLGAGDFEHKMNTVSSIEQSADLMTGIKLLYETDRGELFAKFGAGGYYLEIDDDLPGEYSDYQRDDLSNGELAWFQEYKGRLDFAEKFSVSAKFKNFRSFDSVSLETRKEIELAYHFRPDKQFVLRAEKTGYNLDEFERAAGDNGLQALPFDHDIYYQAYIEFGF